MSLASTPRVSVVIPAYNRADLLERCLESLRRSEGVNWDAVVVDNASPEDLSGVRVQFPEVRWQRLPRNVGYAEANNLGLSDARGQYRCWLNSDAELLPDTLSGLVRHLEAHAEWGAVTPCNIGPDGAPQHTLGPEHTLPMAWLRDSGLHLMLPGAPPFKNWLLPSFSFRKEQEVLTSQTTCLLMRREAYLQTGEMDSALFLFYNDVDWCRRLRLAGWKLGYVPEPRVIHHGSASVDTAPWKERQLWRDRYRFFTKWYGIAGALGVRSACFSRAVARTLSHLVTGRWGTARDVWKLGIDLCRAMDEPENGG